MSQERQKTAAEIKAENDLVMAKAALKLAIGSFKQRKNVEGPKELLEYWAQLSTEEWREHLNIFERELKKLRQPKVREICFDIDNYIRDCKRLEPSFSRSRAEILLMTAIGQIDVAQFTEMLGYLPSNREKLDRKIEKQLKILEWEDEQDLNRLDQLSDALANPKIKKAEIEKIDKRISDIEATIMQRKAKREELAIKLVEWKARGNIDIASSDNKFRLDA